MHRLLLSLDVAAVLLFVTLGRDTHEEGLTLGGIAETAAPFLLALGLGWVATRAWRDATGLATGVGVAALTIVAGMLLRRAAFDEGTAFAFVLVATVFLTTAMLGWRALASRVLERRRAPTG